MTQLRKTTLDQIELPPHSTEAEEGLLACLLLDEDGTLIAHSLSAKITPAHFFKVAHQIIFKAILELHSAGQPYDEIILFDHLTKEGTAEEAGGLAQLYHIQGRVETTAHAKFYAKILCEKFAARSMIRAAREIIEAAQGGTDDPEALAAQAEGQFREIAELTAAEDIFQSGADIAEEQARRLQARTDDPDAGKRAVVSTPLDELNTLFDLGGFGPGEMIVIAGRPGDGKSAFLGNIVEKAVMQERKTALLFSFEMEAVKISDRIVASMTNIPAPRIRRAELTTSERVAVNQAYRQIKAASLFIDANRRNTMQNLRTNATKLKRQLERKGRTLDLVGVDYLQLVKPMDSRLPRHQQVGEISRELKRLAGELGCPFIVLSQLNRESDKQGRKPRLSDLREAGDLEQDADAVILLHKREDTQNEADHSVKPETDHFEMILAKQRDGATGTVQARFVKRFTRFESFKHTPTTQQPPMQQEATF